MLEDAKPEQWEPEVGESVQGVLEAPRKGQFGEYRIMQVTDGRRIYLPNHAALRRVLTLPTGSQAHIRYDGVEETDKGQEFNTYTIAIPPQESSDIPF